MQNRNVHHIVSALLIQEADFRWSAQCLEYDVAVQADSIEGLRDALQDALLAYVAANRSEGREDFAGLPEAPEKFRRIFQRIKADLTLPARPKPTAPTGMPEIEVREMRLLPARAA